MKGRQGWKWRASIALLVALAGWVVTHPPREPRLYEQATHVTSLRDWTSFYGINFLWLSNREFLSGKNLGAFHPLGPGKSMLMRRDILTQQETPLPAMSRLWIESATCIRCGWIISQVSPDGKTLLWEPDGGQAGIWTAPLSGAIHTNTIETNTSMPFAWLPDSRHWIELRLDPKTRLLDWARIHDIDHPEDSSNRPIAPIKTGDRYSQHSAPAVNLFMNLSGDICTFPTSSLDVSKILHIDLISDPIQQQEVLPKFPWDILDIREWASSPGGDRIACMVQSQGQSGVAGWLRKHVPFLAVKQRVVWQLWVCRWDGSNPQLIGCAEPQAGILLEKQRPICLTWLPDGKKLSFVSREELYTVPVP